MTTDAQCIICQSMQQLIQQPMPLQILQDPIRTGYHTTVCKLPSKGLFIASPPPRKIFQGHRIHQDIRNTILKAKRAPDGQHHGIPFMINGNGVWCMREAALELGIDQFRLVQSGMFQKGGLVYAADVVRCYGAKNHAWLLLLLCFFVLLSSSSSRSRIVIIDDITSVIITILIFTTVCTTRRRRRRRRAEDTTTTPSITITITIRRG
mmetsp:Transcript_16482/g.24319  ORF Transcript_16482/g.24319 Transcript_16482/m.24319 type:complete len:208 (+) Transcript_16482:920-1543(+)